ncbi:MAG: hypothetical protein CL609_22835 [Anaerolineaceae bacterium]|nr:hypothetical protein [Anaerolineaceae bacterium]
MSEKNEKQELLMFLYDQSKQEIRFLRERQDKIFSWANNLIAIFIGALLIVDRTKSTIFSNYGIYGKIVASILILSLVAFSIIWQIRNREWQEENKTVISKIAKILKCFDKQLYAEDLNENTSIFPSSWDKANVKQKKMSYFTSINFLTITLLLGFISILMIWFSS